MEIKTLVFSSLGLLVLLSFSLGAITFFRLKTHVHVQDTEFPLFVICEIYCVVSTCIGIFGFFAARAKYRQDPISKPLAKRLDMVLIAILAIDGAGGGVLYGIEVFHPVFLSVTVGFGVMVPIQLLLVIFLGWNYWREYHLVVDQELEALSPNVQ